MPRSVLPFFTGFALLLPSMWAQDPVLLRGRVADLKSGEPLAKVLVSIRDQKLETVTDASGMFKLDGVRPGEVEVYLGAAGYPLVKKRLTVPAGAEFEVEIQFGQETVKRHDQVTVTPTAPDAIEIGAQLEHKLEGAQLRNLSSALFGDALRSLQSLPGAALADEFYAELAYRGAGPPATGYYLDGVPIQSPYHGFRQIGELGSVSLFNGDLVESVAVTGGAPSARFSDGTAAVLRLESKEPKGERPAFRINSDLFQTTIGAEGPLNRKRTATALVSVRKSYLQYLVSRLGHSDLGLGYQDVNAKITYDGGPRHRLTALIIDGSTSADGSDRESERLFETFVKGHHRADSGQFTWSWVPRPRAFVRNSFSWGRQVEDQRNFTGAHLLDATAQQAGLRSDVSFEWTEGHTIESGVEARTSGQEYARFAAWDPVTKTPGGHLSAVSDFNARVWQTGAYLQETWTRAGRWQITAGGRVDRLNYTSEVVWQPRAGLSLALSRRLRWTTSFGRFVRFPDLVELRGPFPNPSLRAERTTNFETGLALQATHGTVLRVDLYDRYIRQMPYSEQTEWRMSGERTLWPLFGAPLRDTLRGYSRGLEIVVERQGANRVAGRVSYSYGHARNDDTATGMHFDADFDQRHSVQAYAGYRLSASVNLSGRFRASSGVPIAGFYRGVADMPEQQFRLSEQRNQVRTSVYQRLDLRLDKAWYRHRSKITVYGEVSNILNRRQWRYYSFDQVPFGTAWGWLHRDRMLPILPAGGVTIEF